MNEFYIRYEREDGSQLFVENGLIFDTMAEAVEYVKDNINAVTDTDHLRYVVVCDNESETELCYPEDFE